MKDYFCFGEVSSGYGISRQVRSRNDFHSQRFPSTTVSGDHDSYYLICHLVIYSAVCPLRSCYYTLKYKDSKFRH
jgi:hypothetical protein